MEVINLNFHFPYYSWLLCTRDKKTKLIIRGLPWCDNTFVEWRNWAFKLFKGLSIKMSAQNCKKLTLSFLVRKMSALAQLPSPPCPRGHTIDFEKSEVFCTKKSGRSHLQNSSLTTKCPNWTTPWPWTSFMDSP